MKNCCDVVHSIILTKFSTSLLNLKNFKFLLFIFQSPYFASMFSGAWKESAMEKIDIEIMDDNINEECE